MRRWTAIAAAVLAVGWSADRVGPRGAIEGEVRVPGASPAGAVVWLVPDGGSPVGTRPGRALIDQRGLRFEPAVVAVAPGSVVDFRNSDPLLHNIFSPERGEPFDLGTYPEGESRSHRFEEPGSHVILCNIHPEMEAHVVVVPSPHRAVTDSTGRFRIEAPAGRYRVYAWHRRGRELERSVTVASGERTRIELRFEPVGNR